VAVNTFPKYLMKFLQRYLKFDNVIIVITFSSSSSSSGNIVVLVVVY
jgi:hypothetical protein